MTENTTEDERKTIEILIKFDYDDDQAPKSFNYPFCIRTFRLARGEGRSSLHHGCLHMFGRIDPKSKFVLLPADDFIFTRKGFVSDILSIKDEFCIVETDKTDLKKFCGSRYKKNQKQWRAATAMAAPTISTRLIEVCSGFGFHEDTDCWAHLLSIILFDEYNINIRKFVEPFSERKPQKRTLGKGVETFNRPLAYRNTRFVDKESIDKWFDLVKQQAKNVYLNYAQERISTESILNM